VALMIEMSIGGILGRGGGGGVQWVYSESRW
jgi:hypothetical protein